MRHLGLILAREMAKAERPAAALGRFVRRVREGREIRQVKLAELTGIPNATISRLEAGENVEIAQYEKYARGLGYRNALELIRSGGDPLSRRLLRLWDALEGDEQARKDVLEQMKAMIDADAE